MESLRDDRGQSLVIAVLALAIAAAAVIGLRGAQDRVADIARAHRAGEAAVEAAAAALADFCVKSAGARDVGRLVTDAYVHQAARAAADELARENGAEGVDDLEIACSGTTLETRLHLRGYAHRAGFTAPECSPH